MWHRIALKAKMFSIDFVFHSSCSSCFRVDVSSNSCGCCVLLRPSCSTPKQEVKSRSGISVPTPTETYTGCSVTKWTYIALLEEVAIPNVHQAIARGSISHERSSATSNNHNKIFSWEWNVEEHRLEHRVEITWPGTGWLRRIRKTWNARVQASLSDRTECVGGFRRSMSGSSLTWQRQHGCINWLC